MKKLFWQQISCLLLLLLFNIIILYVLYSMADLPNKNPNGFNRIFKENALQRFNEKSLKFNSFYIAGLTRHTIFLGNTVASQLLLNVKLDHLNETWDTIEDITKFRLSSALIQIDSPRIWITDPARYGIFIGNTNNFKLNRFRADSTFFSEAVILGVHSCVLRTFCLKNTLYTLLKERQVGPTLFASDPDILRPQIDGMYSLDGHLEYDSVNARLIYTYFYRNQYLCLDTNLALIYTGKLIDTNQWAKIHTARTLSDHSIVLSTPPLLVNSASSIWDNHLFIVSRLVADNENRDQFDRSVVVDVYDLQTGLYCFSFHVPKQKGEKLKSFKVSAGRLALVFEHRLLIGCLRPFFFNDLIEPRLSLKMERYIPQVPLLPIL